MATHGSSGNGDGPPAGGNNDGLGDDSAAARAASADAPPFYTWNKIYGFVLVVLAVEVVIFTVLTHLTK